MLPRDLFCNSTNHHSNITQMVTTAKTYHIPVLMKDSVDGLNIGSAGIYVDVTFGGADTAAKFCRVSTPTDICTASTRTPTPKRIS